VEFVAEQDIPGIRNGIGFFLYGVAFHTFTYFESPFAVMARPAGFPLFHLRHGDARVGSGLENLVVAGIALHGAKVPAMAECHLPGRFDLIGDFFNLVASGAFCQCERLDSGMAGPAGFPLLHLRHGVVAGIQFTTLMACLATEIRGSPCFVAQMGLVAEDHLSRILGCEGYILELHCERERSSGKKYDRN
jgi:hypothetical protein